MTTCLIILCYSFVFEDIEPTQSLTTQEKAQNFSEYSVFLGPRALVFPSHWLVPEAHLQSSLKRLGFLSSLEIARFAILLLCLHQFYSVGLFNKWYGFVNRSLKCTLKSHPIADCSFRLRLARVYFFRIYSNSSSDCMQIHKIFLTFFNIWRCNAH